MKPKTRPLAAAAAAAAPPPPPRPRPLPTLLLLLASVSVGRCADQGPLLPEGPLDVVSGGNASLRTLLGGAGYKVILWNFNDGGDAQNVVTVEPDATTVAQAYRERVIVNRTDGSLQLLGVTAADSGGYTMSVVRSAGTRTDEIELRVLEPVSNVAISSNVATAMEAATTVVLTCSAQGSFLEFSWINGTTAIDPLTQPRLTLTQEENLSTLTIAKVLRDDLRGPIFCRASNSLETKTSAAFNLTVYYGPEKVEISPRSPPEFVPLGSSFNLTCSASSLPPATFSWTFNGSLLEVQGSELSLETLSGLGLGAQPGGYHCTAHNTHTNRSLNSTPVVFSTMEPVSGVQVSGPNITLLAGDHGATLACRAAAGAAGAAAAWTKDGRELAADGRRTFSEDGKEIIFKTLDAEDNGVYTCTVSNAVSSSKAQYQLRVHYGPEAVSVEGEAAVEVSDPVTLTCSARSLPPATFTWKFNGTASAQRGPQYVIAKAKYKDTGVYTCEAHNNVTAVTAVSAHNLSVKEEGALDEGLSDGAIAGIVIAIIVALAAAIGLVMYCRQKVPVESPY